MKIRLKDRPRSIASRICGASAYQLDPSAAASGAACDGSIAATRSTSIVGRETPRTDEACDPPSRYAMRRRSNSLVSSRSEFIAVDAREKIVAKRLMSKFKEYFALRRVRTPTPDASENQTPGQMPNARRRAQASVPASSGAE